ncbi:MAG: IS66 family insertion sequence element accessory protein TnpB [Polyangiaceae bacterium]|nr:IS66 family insertion sequence element accessory protein TnpB [Polyangiaceae bacterium]
MPVSIGDSGALTVRVGRAVVQVREPEQIDAVWLARFVSQVEVSHDPPAQQRSRVRGDGRREPAQVVRGLSNEVRCVLGDDPLSGHVFLFLNRRGCQVKMLVWTRGGFTIVHKRLERGRFTFPERVRADAVRVEIDAHELAMLLEGLDLSSSPSARRWAPRRKASGDRGLTRSKRRREHRAWSDEITRDGLCTARWRAKARRCAGAPATWPASCSTGATMPRCSRWSASSLRRARSLSAASRPRAAGIARRSSLGAARADPGGAAHHGGGCERG